MKKLSLFSFAICFVVLLQAQNVGIGLTNPGYPLTVQGLANGKSITSRNGSLEVGFFNNGNAAFVQTWSAHDLNFATNNGLPLMTIANTTGYVGIGIGQTAPLARLHVAGSTAADSVPLLLENQAALATRSNVGLYFKNGNSYTAAIKTIGESNQSARLSFLTYAYPNRSVLSEQMTISNTGEVGIGVTTPEMHLHVSNPADSAVLLLENQTPLNTGINTGMYFKTGAYYTGALKTTGTGANSARLSLYTYAGNNTSTLKEQFSILDNGFTGIGTPSPIMRLHIVNESTATDASTLLLDKPAPLNNNSNVSMYFRNGGRYTGGIKTIGTGTTIARLSFFTGSGTGLSGLQERLTISNDGNVGINAVNPINQLEVVGTSKFSQGTDDVAMEISGPIRVSGSNKPAFVLVCNANNLSDVYTPTINYVPTISYYSSVIIDNTLCNGDPNAIVMVTPQETPLSFAVAYDNSLSKWKIRIDHHSVKEDGCWGSGSPSPSCGPYSKVFLDYLPIRLIVGQKFNVMIIKQ